LKIDNRRMRKPKKQTPSRTKPRKQAAGCTVTLKWSLLNDTTDFVQVWIPKKRFKAVAAHFMKAAKGKDAKKRLQTRLAKVGLDQTCGGECEGGGGAACYWLPVPPDPDPDPESITEVCDCFLSS
jgi:hypothetical protein